MRVLLVSVDSKIPNLALGRLSTYYKGQGHSVDYIDLGLDGYPSVQKKLYVGAEKYDKVFVSIIFRKNQRAYEVVGCNDVDVGGPGSADMKKRLLVEVERCEIDYTLWPDNDTSYGFITRGCIRNCYFCLVPKMEGGLRFERSIDEIIRHDKVSFMDNNFLAYCEHEKILKELIDKEIKCCFNQGLDLRLINNSNAELLSKLKYIGEYVFAFDDIKVQGIIEDKLALFKKYVNAPWKVKFFIYCNAEKMEIVDMVFRVEWCRHNECLPYVMRDSNCWASVDNKFYIDFAAYCNQPAHFKQQLFTEFLIKRYPANRQRVVVGSRLYIKGLSKYPGTYLKSRMLAEKKSLDGFGRVHVDERVFVQGALF